MLWIGLALSLSGAIGDGKSLILKPVGEQVQVMVAEGTGPLPPRRTVQAAA